MSERYPLTDLVVDQLTVDWVYYYIKQISMCSIKLWTAHCQHKADTIKDILTHVRLHVLIKGTYCEGYYIYSCSDEP